MRIDLPQPRKEWLTRRISQSLLEKHFIRCHYPPTKLRSEKKTDCRASAKPKWLTGKTAMDIDLLNDFVANFNTHRTFERVMEVAQAANRLEKNATKKPDSEDDDEEQQNMQEHQIIIKSRPRISKRIWM
ncbi:14282_t:CDS:2 [Ambispora leptoticha]|uniref:14282_t:CDS:1 n=1 Tax=Ambispora leptoticha TaxID=144679 RepID=A0A9N9B4B5_9GLOM|nr:14282_t:CDS:2 [Ambispora leptoticha]